ncbi:hypothetical protein [Pseudonocardia phyllosphaerae]|uniref:hypothetical protein n=1 Tax=Pseudonocardia phyllosphaerae TaxID=3390502 RepID=UPI00397C9B74
MSFTGQLRDGVLAAWCAEHLPGTGDAVRALGRATAGVTPLRPDGATGARHWAQVGEVVSSRLSALVQDAAPYASLLGFGASGLASPQALNRISGGYPAQAAVLAEEPELVPVALGVHPTPSDVVALPVPRHAPPERWWGDAVLADLAASERDRRRRDAPTGTVGDDDTERGLARDHHVWTLGEDCYRSGAVPRPLAAYADRTGSPGVEQLRGLAPRAVVDDAAAVVGRVATSDTLAQWRSWAGDPPPGQALGYAAPVLWPRWAEADLLVGDTLVEVKTVLRADQKQRSAQWLCQLLGYAWLDDGDRWGIRHVAFYLARHGVVVHWTVDELAALLVGDPARVGAVRADFRAVARRAAGAEGAPPLPPV